MGLSAGELVAESEAVVEEAEAECEEALGLVGAEVQGELAEVVADGGVFAPYGLPGAVDGDGVDGLDAESVGKGSFVGTEAHAAWGHDGSALVFERIYGRAGRIDVGLKAEVSVGGEYACGAYIQGCGEQE